MQTLLLLSQLPNRNQLALSSANHRVALGVAMYQVLIGLPVVLLAAAALHNRAESAELAAVLKIHCSLPSLLHQQ